MTYYPVGMMKDKLMDSGMAKNSAISSCSPTNSSDEIVWEVENIAKVIGRTERQTFHLLSTGQIPAKKVGGRWVASRTKLLAAVLGDAA